MRLAIHMNITGSNKKEYMVVVSAKGKLLFVPIGDDEAMISSDSNPTIKTYILMPAYLTHLIYLLKEITTYISFLDLTTQRKAAVLLLSCVITLIISSAYRRNT